MEKVYCEKTGINGEGIAYHNKKVLFIPGLLPGEEAEIEITKDNQTYSQAKIKKVLKKSPDRQRSICREQNHCRACTLAHLKYEAQLQEKTRILTETLWKYAHVKQSLIRTMHASPDPWHYRNACKLPVRQINGSLVSGMYAPDSNIFVPLPDCPAHTAELETFRKNILTVLNAHQVQPYSSKTKQGLRGLILRVIDHQASCTLITGQDTLSKELIQDLADIPDMISLSQSLNTEKNKDHSIGSKPRILAGAKTIEITTNGIRLQLSPASFYQLNTKQAEKIYDMAVQKINPCHTFIEAYCGVGAISLLASNKAELIYGIENVPDAIANAKANAKANNITNTEFKCADASELKLYGQADCLVVDPPRSGLDPNMIQTILETKPKRIVYISCNPSTLAKNLNDLRKNYLVRTVIPFDMFPETAHIETLTVLDRG